MTTTKKPPHQQERPDWHKKHIEKFDLAWGHLKPSNLYDLMLIDEYNKLDRNEITELDLVKPTYEQLLAENATLKKCADLYDLRTAERNNALEEIATLKRKLERIEKAQSMRSADIYLEHNMSPLDYLNKEISEALYGDSIKE